jgi:hypothetical protein
LQEKDVGFSWASGLFNFPFLSFRKMLTCIHLTEAVRSIFADTSK